MAKSENPGGLSEGQWQTIQQKAQGVSFAEMAHQRSSAESTHQNLASQGYQKLGAHNIVEAVRQLVESGQAQISDFVSPQQVKDFQARSATLTPAERDILQEMWNNPESAPIAQTRNTAPKTVKNQRSTIGTKLGIDSQTAAIRMHATQQEKPNS